MINTLNKSLNFAILVISNFISGIYVDLAGAQNTSSDPAASRRLIVSGPYLKFGRLTTKDGLSKPIIIYELFTKAGRSILDWHGRRPISTKASFCLTK